MKIPFVDLKAQYRSIREEIDAAIRAVIETSAFIRGKFVEEFEASFAAYCGLKHCLGVGNGTDALIIALRALGVGPGDEVIVPANSFIATSEAVTNAGARVVFADVDPLTCNLDPAQMAARITGRTKAVIPVHLYGRPADLPAICALARKHGIKVIQDCAQAHGASIDGRPLGSFGDVLCFSFYPGKNLGAYGDAGAVLTDDDETARRIKMYANHGRVTKYDHEFEGINSRMDGLQGAVLNVKLRHLESWTESRRRHAGRYDELLGGLPGLALPQVDNGVRQVYHLYVVRSAKREELQQHLQAKGVSSGVHYPIALPNLTAYRYLGHRPEDFPVSSRYQNEVLSLPMYPEMTGEMIEWVAEAIEEFQVRG